MKITHGLIETFIEDRQCIQAMPESSVRILQLLQNPNFRMEQLIRLIKQDAAIAARVIQVVNSAAYARTNKITQLDRAAIYLGVNTVKEIVTATAVSAVCKPMNVGKYATRDLWNHCVGVAVLSREFALRSKTFDPELAFLAGILHDIGLLLCVQSEAETSAEIFVDAEDGKIHYAAIEKSYFGFDHTELGQRLAAAWRFPDEVASVIRFHHTPMHAPLNVRQLCAHVYIADTLCAEAGVGFPLTCSMQKADDRTFKEAGLNRADTDAVIKNFKVLLRLHAA